MQLPKRIDLTRLGLFALLVMLSPGQVQSSIPADCSARWSCRARDCHRDTDGH